jgi:hypothetical protein
MVNIGELVSEETRARMEKKHPADVVIGGMFFVKFEMLFARNANHVVVYGRRRRSAEACIHSIELIANRCDGGWHTEQ